MCLLSLAVCASGGRDPVAAAEAAEARAKARQALLTARDEAKRQDRLRSIRRQPNIYIYVADDLRGDKHGVGIAGNPYVDTPVIDAFARGAVQFTRMYTPMAMCVPSRTAMHTGLYPFKSGVWRNHAPVTKSLKMAPGYLRELNYTVAMGGKRHFTPESAFAFDYFDDHTYDVREGGLQTYIDDTRKVWARKAKKAGRNITAEPPWCIYYCSGSPHAPHRPDGTYPFYGDRYYTLHGATVPAKWPTTLSTIHKLAGMYNDINRLDREFAVFLKVIKMNFLSVPRSVTIFTSDHGGSHFAKWSCYDDGLRVPFYVQLKGMAELGHSIGRVDMLASFVDLLPTLVELAGGGAVPAGGTDGVSLLPALRAASVVDIAPRFIFGMHTARGTRCVANPYPIRAVIGPRFKYIRNFNHQSTYQSNMINSALDKDKLLWGEWLQEIANDGSKKDFVELLQCRPSEELYDLDTDPGELHNLAQTDSTYVRATLEDMRSALQGWMAGQGDTDPVASEMMVPLRDVHEDRHVSDGRDVCLTSKVNWFQCDGGDAANNDSGSGSGSAEAGSLAVQLPAAVAQLEQQVGHPCFSKRAVGKFLSAFSLVDSDRLLTTLQGCTNACLAHPECTFYAYSSVKFVCELTGEPLLERVLVSDNNFRQTFVAYEKNISCAASTSTTTTATSRTTTTNTTTATTTTTTATTSTATTTTATTTTVTTTTTTATTTTDTTTTTTSSTTTTTTIPKCSHDLLLDFVTPQSNTTGLFLQQAGVVNRIGVSEAPNTSSCAWWCLQKPLCTAFALNTAAPEYACVTYNKVGSAAEIHSSGWAFYRRAPAACMCNGGVLLEYDAPQSNTKGRRLHMEGIVEELYSETVHSSTDCALARQSQIINRKWRNIWIRDVFCASHQSCWGSQPKHVSNPAYGKEV